jgi:hypothetical protein
VKIKQSCLQVTDSLSFSPIISNDIGKIISISNCAVVKRGASPRGKCVASVRLGRNCCRKYMEKMRQEITREWRILHSEVLHDSCLSPYLTKVITSKKDKMEEKCRMHGADVKSIQQNFSQGTYG